MASPSPRFPLRPGPAFRPWLVLPLVAAAPGLVLGLALEHTGRTPQPPPAPVRVARSRALPPPPPPAAFIQLGRPSLAQADRDWTRLAPDFRAAVLDLSDRMARRGYALAFLEGYRSPERQALLAKAGRTPAAAFHSLHQYGLAADFGFMDEGALVVSEQTSFGRGAYEALGQEAAALGLVWGGSWRTRDPGHVELALAAPSLLRRQTSLPSTDPCPLDRP